MSRGWRGLLLDSARHFLPIPDIKRQIDGMAAAKAYIEAMRKKFVVQTTEANL